MSFLILSCLIGCVFGQLIVNESNDSNWEQDSPAAQFLGLSSGVSSVVPNIRATFSCLGRRYGYFADVDNNCQIFHVCHPSVAANGEPVIYHFSKFCPKSTRFDQRQLTCLHETDPKLISCSDSSRLYPPVESRLANVPVVKQLENIQQLPEIEQRVEQVVEEQRQEPLPVKGIQSEGRVLNERIPLKSVVRNEPIPQQVPQIIPVPVVEQRVEPVVSEGVDPVVQQRVEPLVQQVVEPIGQRAALTPIQQTIPVQTVVNQPIVSQIPAEVRNVEPIQQQTLPLTESVSPVERSPVKQNEIISNLRTTPAVINKGYVAPALALRSPQPVVQSEVPVQTPVQITRPVLIESDVNLRRTAPQTQYITQSRPLVQPLYVPQQYLSQPYRSQPLIQTPRVVRPSQYSVAVNRSPIVADQRPILYIPVQNTYQSIPQYLRSNVQPNVVRPAQNPIFARLSNKQ